MGATLILVTTAALGTAGAMAIAGWGLPGIAMAGPRAGERIAKLVPQFEVTVLLLVGVAIWSRMLRFEGFEAFRRALAATVRGPRQATWSRAATHLGMVAELLLAGSVIWMLAGLLEGGPSLAEIARVRLMLFVFAGFWIGLGAWASAVGQGSRAALGTCLSVLLAMAAAPFAIAPVLSVVGGRSELILASMLLSPWIVTAGLSGLDILRMQWVYALSPLGSLDAPYPGLGPAAAAYAGAGALLLLAAPWVLRGYGFANGGRG